MHEDGISPKRPRPEPASAEEEEREVFEQTVEKNVCFAMATNRETNVEI